MAAVVGTGCRGVEPQPLLKVRTCTVGISLRPGDRSQWFASLQAATAFNAAARARLTADGFEVQTVRVASNSFEEWCNVLDEEATLKAFHALDTELQRLDIGLFNAGPAASPAALALVPRLVAIGPRISFSGTMSFK